MCVSAGDVPFPSARTYLLSNFEHQVIASLNASYLPLAPGQTLAFCNGLGGRSVRPDTECTLQSPCPWFASKENSDTGVKAAALFCRYHVRGDPNLADCYLKGIDDKILDAFTLDSSAMPR
jgi:hypothetical protein